MKSKFGVLLMLLLALSAVAVSAEMRTSETYTENPALATIGGIDFDHDYSADIYIPSRIVWAVSVIGVWRAHCEGRTFVEEDEEENDKANHDLCDRWKGYIQNDFGFNVVN